MLFTDILVIYVAVLLISMIEDNRFNVDNFTVFHILFEVVSAYGTVGISMGYLITKPTPRHKDCSHARSALIGADIQAGHSLSLEFSVLDHSLLSL